MDLRKEFGMVNVISLDYAAYDRLLSILENGVVAYTDTVRRAPQYQSSWESQLKNFEDAAEVLVRDLQELSFPIGPEQDDDFAVPAVNMELNAQMQETMLRLLIALLPAPEPIQERYLPAKRPRRPLKQIPYTRFLINNEEYLCVIRAIVAYSQVLSERAETRAQQEYAAHAMALITDIADHSVMVVNNRGETADLLTIPTQCVGDLIFALMPNVSVEYLLEDRFSKAVRNRAARRK